MSILEYSDAEALLRSMLHAQILAEGHLPLAPESLRADIPLGTLPGLTRAGLLTVARNFTLFLGAEKDVCLLSPEETLAQWANSVFTGWKSSTPLIFQTSGSTGAPVRCPQPLSLLWQETAALAEFLADRKRIVSVVPKHHIYGFLFSLLLPKRLGVPCLLLPPFPGPDCVHLLARGDVLIAFPFFWKALAALPQSPEPQVSGVTSTGPCPPEVLQDLRAKGWSRITEVYGASETGGMGFRHNCGDPFTLFAHWLPDKDKGCLTRILPDGSLSTPYVVPDELRWTDTAQFYPLQRKDRAVQVGGVNVFPLRVAQILGEHPGVQDCAVRLMRPEEGQRLKAFVVPCETVTDWSGLKKELEIWLRARVQAAEMPRKITCGKTLPCTALGKAADW